MSALYVVATPIGNLGDMSPRAVDTLKKVSLIAAEDTRVTMKLTSHFGISTPLTSCHQHNERGKSSEIVRRMLDENIDVALVTDAGTPAISDPGTFLVKEAAAAGIPVYAVAGPSAMAAAVSVSGFDITEFTFFGFLPRQKGELKEKLYDIASRCTCAVIHESPYRVKELVKTITETLPGALISASCDLTKLHELTLRGSAEEIFRALDENEKSDKGEYCLVVDLRNVKLPEKETPSADITVEAKLVEAMISEGTDLRGAMEILKRNGEKKNAVYAASLNLRKLFCDE